MCLTEIKKTKYNISEALSPHFGVLGFMFACHLQQGGLTSQSSLLQLLQVIQLSDRITQCACQACLNKAFIVNKSPFS